MQRKDENIKFAQFIRFSFVLELHIHTHKYYEHSYTHTHAFTHSGMHTQHAVAQAYRHMYTKFTLGDVLSKGRVRV